MEDHLSRRFFLHHVFGGSPDLCFHASPADRSRHRAVFTHQHSRALITRNRAVRVHDGGQRAALSAAPHFHDFFEQVHRLPLLPAYGARSVLSMHAAFWTLLMRDDTVPLLLRSEES